MSKFEVILFDADDTLFDFQKSEKHNLNKTFQDFQVPYNEEIESEYNCINKELWEEYNQGKITKKYLKVIRFEKLFSKYNINCNPEKFNDIYLANLAENSFLMDDVENICKILSKELKLVIATNAVSKVAHRKIEKSNINKYISDIFVSDDIGIPKPQIGFFEYIFNRLEYPKEKMIMVGDSLTTDILGGNNAGLETCWFNQFKLENKTDIIPTYEINNLNELIELLEIKSKG